NYFYSLLNQEGKAVGRWPFIIANLSEGSFGPICSCGFSLAEGALLRGDSSFRRAGESFEESLRQVARGDEPLHLVETCDDEPPGLLLEHHAGRCAKGCERTDRCHRRGHDVPDQDLRWVPSGRCDFPQDIAVGEIGR